MPTNHQYVNKEMTLDVNFYYYLQGQTYEDIKHRKIWEDRCVQDKKINHTR